MSKKKKVGFSFPCLPVPASSSTWKNEEGEGNRALISAHDHWKNRPQSRELGERECKKEQNFLLPLFFFTFVFFFLFLWIPQLAQPSPKRNSLTQ